MLSNRNFRNIALGLLCVVASGACSKKTNENAKSTLLTTSTWKYSDAGIDTNGDGTIDQAFPAGTLQTCQTDFILTFKSDKTGVIDEGPTKCASTDPQTNPFTWELQNNDTEINFSTNIIVGFGGATRIVELTATKLVLSKSVTVPGVPIAIPATVILVH